MRPFRRRRYERRPPWARPGFAARARKPRGPLVPGRMLNPRLQRELRRANHLLAVGDHLNAAHIFVSLAERARDVGIIYPAPMLFMQAAHAFLLGEEFDLSLQNAQTGLELLAAQERWRALDHAGNRYIDELQNAGQREPAGKLRAWLDENLQGKAIEEPAPSDNADEAQLPEKCPYCGGSLSLEQINAGGRAAECQYCGSVVLPRSAD